MIPKIGYSYVVVRQADNMNTGDQSAEKSINYYVGEQRYWTEGPDFGQCVLLAHVGAGIKGLTKASEFVNEGNEKGLSPGQVQRLAWEYIVRLHAEAKAHAASTKATKPRTSAEHVVADEPAGTARNDAATAPAGVAGDVNAAIKGEIGGGA